MDENHLLSQMRGISRRVHTLKYTAFNWRSLVTYERYYARWRSKSDPKLAKLASQYFLQSLLGIYRTDYGCVKCDYLIAGCDHAVSLIAALKLIQSGHSVLYWPYGIEDYSGVVQAYTQARSKTIPPEAMAIIQGDMGVNSGLDYDALISELADRITQSPQSDNFSVLEASRLSSFEIIDETPVSLATMLDHTYRDDRLDKLNKCVVFDSLEKNVNSRYNRRIGRLISMVQPTCVIYTSQMTKDTPRIASGYELFIGDGQRNTKDIEDLRYVDRNEDIMQALAICKIIRGS